MHGVKGLAKTCLGADVFAASVCAWPGVLIMSVNAPITSADCRRKREVMRIVPSDKAARFFQNAAWPLYLSQYRTDCPTIASRGLDDRDPVDEPRF